MVDWSANLGKSGKVEKELAIFPGINWIRVKLMDRIESWIELANQVQMMTLNMIFCHALNANRQEKDKVIYFNEKHGSSWTVMLFTINIFTEAKISHLLISNERPAF